MFGDLQGMMGKLKEAQAKIEETKARLNTVMVDGESKIRVPIPKAKERKLLVESGHKCSVPLCNENYSLSFHHINGDPSDNREFNIIVLCRNHHDMADRGRIDRKECASYKEILKQTKYQI